ncbi:MAG: sulfite exporter TauE/SafE family protein [Peptococcaceae bacterium]|nr:sulfite exporter TauE/SafE family protein [Peptococcaceae bacterium]
MYLPIADTVVNPYALLLIGFCVGVLGGFFGVGGAFMVTPALNIFGFPMAFAIGTDIAHIFGKSIVATFKHALLKHVDWKLGIIVGLTGMYGVQLGKQTIMYLEKIGQVGPIVRIVYIALLFGVGAFMLAEYVKFQKRQEINEDGSLKAEADISPIARKLQNLRIPPMISLPTSGIKAYSLWLIIALGIFTGFVSGFLGVGGGFVRVPMFIYLMGLPTTVAVGTDLLGILISNLWGSYTYAIAGRVEVIGAMVMLLGAGVGAQIGSVATAYVKGMRIRLYFAVTVLLAGVAVIFKQLQWSTAAGVLMLGSACTLSAIVIILLIKGVAEAKQAQLELHSRTTVQDAR